MSRHIPASKAKFTASVDITAAGFGKAVAAERKRAGMSQSVLARHAGISVSYLKQLEWGNRTPSVAMINLLGRALNCGAIKLVVASVETK